MLSKKFFIFSVLALVVSGCSSNVEFTKMNNGSFAPVPQPIPLPGGSGTAIFNLSLNQFQQKQVSYPKNVITAQFQVLDGNGLTINGLGKDKFQVTENGAQVSNFNLTQQNTGYQQDADIVVVLDVTTSMDPSIEKVKAKIGSFVDVLAKSNIRARLCLVQFTDNVEQVCDKFVEDNPATTANENYDDFMKKIKAIKTHDGGYEMDEGQLAALEAAAQKTPWHSGAQRVAILVTDAGFHYTPDNNNEGVYVPTYANTLDIVRLSKMQTFVISVFKPGYDRDFGNLPPVTQATGGVFYNLNNVLSGITDMADIFKNIAGNLMTTYTLNYTVEDNSGLNSELSLDQRNIKIKLDWTVSGTLKMSSLNSSQPSGHASLPKKFTLSSKDIWRDSVKVKVNGATSTSYSLTDRDVDFSQAPPQDALIEVSFYHFNMRDDLQFAPLLYQFPNNVDLSKLVVSANGFKLKAQQFEARLIDARTLYLDLKDSVFSIVSDPVDIKKRGLLVLDFSVK